MNAQYSNFDLGQISGGAIALEVVKKSVLFDREAEEVRFTGVYRFPTKSAFAKLDLSTVLTFLLRFWVKPKMKGQPGQRAKKKSKVIKRVFKGIQEPNKANEKP